MSKTNENILITIPQNFFDILKDKHLLLDTSVFIDVSNHPIEFAGFFEQCKKNEVFLTTIFPVQIEFIKGISYQEIQERKKLISDIIADEYSSKSEKKEYLLPFDKNIFQHFEFLLGKYKQDGNRVSLTDLSLGATLINYGPQVMLLTKNNIDFPTSIFSRKTHLLIEMKKTIQPYGIYSYEKNTH